ncbi:MAG: patatin-like protein [Aulosira sp. ZfuVER01]|nr:patatin-like protein [Aulosira sp. ZfuVER01]MDZ8000826.1 patatin-like protein [Aulosira sp. DedVER01a]MDZ8055903.1 patatin-like protein [Aulosira sp. ZfuCHP01]
MMNSTANQLLETPEFSQEFRLGLVVYGGVSLAIYMNGVCREFYNAVRGRGIYKLIKALTDSDIIVDVISGTSAGGINGVLLSYALTNSDREFVVDFNDFAEIWSQSGDISQLLRNPHSQKDINSILDGEVYYQKQLAQAFDRAWEKKKPASQKDEWFSDSSELDLFVTGTDTLGRVYTAFDNTGCLIEVKDHRSVFQLKYRRGRKHPFQPEKSPAAHSALAKLCRITSCFPVAFPVVSVGLNKPNINSIDKEKLAAILQDPQHPDYEKYVNYAVDPYLVKWGQLDNRELPLEDTTEHGHRLHFVDGGVLDNRPFSYTIREIYYRTAHRPVTRRLFYIDPTPDQFLGSPKFKKMAQPNIWETVSDSLVGLPRYESISNDLQEIKEHNQRVMRYKFLRGTAERMGEQRRNAVQVENYQLSEDEKRREQIYLRCRLVGLRDRILPLLLRIDQVSTSVQNDRQNRNKQKLLETAAQLLTTYIIDKEKQEKREAFLHDFGIQIRNLDVDYALRKHFYLLEKICQFMVEPQYQHQAPALKQLADKLNHQVELLEIIQATLERMLQSDKVSQTFYSLIAQAQGNREQTRQQIYNYLLGLHRFLLEAQDLPKFKSTDTPTDSAEDIDEIEQPENLVNVDFFTNLPYSLIPNKAQLDEKDKKLISAKVSNVYSRLKQKANSVKPDELLKDDSCYNLDAVFQNDKSFENNSNVYCSILFKIEEATENLISSSQVGVDWELLHYFQGFRYMDEEVYSYEYLSNIQAKEQLEIVRISPDVANLGFGKGKNLEDKLAGDQFYAFGGFFKKSWRSNDILWGRLDGLNRIVEALLTPEALKNFSGFLSRQLNDGKALEGTEEKTQQYLSTLVDEALPEATPSEKANLIVYLTKLAAPNRTLKVEELSNFLDTIVTAGHRAILKTDLVKVLEDANQEILKEPEKIDDYFRNQYHIGSEKLTKSIQPIILEDLVARTGLILRNILKSPPSDRYLNKSVTFWLVERLLQIYYVWVQAKKRTISLIPTDLRSLTKSIAFIVLFVVVTLFLLKSLH